MKSLHLITTGGTIDSIWDPTKDTAVPTKETSVLKIFNNAKLQQKTLHTAICAKDSRDVNDEDRKQILESIETSPHKHVLITHGTYTLPDTAEYLDKALKRRDQVIILTGSMIPMDGFTFSDGPFNLGFALAKMDEIEPGVYVSMSGELFEAGNVAKLTGEGRFVRIFGA